MCHVSSETRIPKVDPVDKEDILVLSHPYMEDYVVLPTRHGIRSENRLAGPKLEEVLK